jgi:uncharacterized membrane protein YeaQ/YmgE (transglycosylase-associated protein family)
MMAIAVPVIGALAGWIAAGRKSGLTIWSSIGIGILGAMIGSVVVGVFRLPLPWLLAQVLGPSAGAAIFLAVTHIAHARTFPRDP